MPSSLDRHLDECLQRGAHSIPGGKRKRDFSRFLLAAALFVTAFCMACGAVGSGPSQPVTVSVSPSSAQPYQGDSMPFQATVENAASPAVRWQVNGTTGGNAIVGTIDSNGVYTAPASVPTPPTVTVTAVLQSDSTKSGSSNVTIQSLSAYTGPLLVSPSLTSATASQTIQFSVQTPGISNSNVTWSASGGTISASGSYTPPFAPGPYTIEASLPHATGFATVEVPNFSGVLTWRNDNSRSGINNEELMLSPVAVPGLGAVSSKTFGLLFRCTIDGDAYAQPLYVPNVQIPGNGMHNVIFVATENDSVFAFDADSSSCEQVWPAASLIPPGPPGSQPIAFPNLNVSGTDIVPFVGITGTPAIDPTGSMMYVVAASQTVATEANLNPAYSQRIYALDLTTGLPAIQPAGFEIGSSAPQAAAFNSSVENQRPALLLDHGTVYVGFGSYGGVCAGLSTPCPYEGWLYSFNSTTLEQTGVFNVTPSAPQGGGGIWQSGGGPAADAGGNVFVSTGDGPFGQSKNGMNFSDSFIQFQSGGELSVQDSFTPCQQGTLETSAQDVGTGASVILPDSAGSAEQPRLLIAGSGNGSLYVVNRDNMGGHSSDCSTESSRVQVVPTGAGAILSTPLFWNGSVYVAPGNGSLMSFPLIDGVLTPPFTMNSPEMLGAQGATPVISSNGANNAILWLVDSSGANATPNTAAILRAYDPNNLSNEIYNSAMAPASRDQAGPAVKFTVPTVANGKVYVGTQKELDVYGLLP